MRATTVALSLVALLAHGADGGATSAAKSSARDGGAADVGAVAPGASSPFRAKPFLVFADEPAVFDKYVVAKPAERATLKGMLAKLTIGKRAAAAIVVEGYELPFSRRVDLTADLVITDPTGRVVLDKASIAIAHTMDPKTMLLVPLAPTFGMVFGLTDPEGDYRVRLTLWDQVRGASAVVETKFAVSR